MNSLDEIARQIGEYSQPPVHLWHPETTGEMDMLIDSQGRWWHEGELIKRDSLVALFASILWAEDEHHYLVTPVEKWRITVADVPYVIHQVAHVDDAWVATTNTHEQVIIGASNCVELRRYQGQWLPYVNVRYNLWARVNRSIYYQWVDTALERDEQALTLQSADYEFAVAKLDE